ncbi:MAG: glycosyltransferase family 4 protein [Bauldia sp.]|nr:glycosyltransferase family 4 protein [Bauldia sp.]
MTDPIRVAIASAGRFHVLDLARELLGLGFDVRFYSYVPAARAEAFGVPRAALVSLLPAAAPMLAWARALPGVAPGRREAMLHRALDRAVARRLRPCDVLIAMSGIYRDALVHARRRFGASVWLERGSRHILSQDEILAGIPGAARPTADTIARELDGYRFADRIVVPSGHAAASFARDADAAAKVFLDPLGVDLAAFPQRAAPREGRDLRLVFAGSWSLRKGCDVLAAAMAGLDGVTLTHAGGIGDCPFPSGDARFASVGAVDQAELPRIYGDADTLVLPSREDGFGMVLTQALASGLGVIASDRTGAPDLATTPALRERITIVPHGDAAALRAAIVAARDRRRSGEVLPALAASDRGTLSWRAYADRYAEELRRHLAGRR